MDLARGRKPDYRSVGYVAHAEVKKNKANTIQ